MLFFDIHIVSIVSSVSARKLKCPSLAWLGTFIARLEPENSSSGSSLVASISLWMKWMPLVKTLAYFICSLENFQKFVCKYFLLKLEVVCLLFMKVGIYKILNLETLSWKVNIELLASLENTYIEISRDCLRREQTGREQ